jgi:hypothetical protein
MCIVIDLIEKTLVSLVNLRLHTMTPTVLTMDPSARVTTRRSLAAVGVRSASCLAVASLQKLADKQPVSIRQLMETERDGVATGAKVPKTRGYSSGPPRMTPKCRGLPSA